MTDTDPLALIIAAGGAVISGLASITLVMLFARLGRSEKKLDMLSEDLMGKDGSWSRMSKLEEWARGAEARLQALERGHLSKEFFERETLAQNKRLEDLQSTTRELDRKVDNLKGRTYSPLPTKP